MMRTEQDLINDKIAENQARQPKEVFIPRVAGLDPGKQKDSFAMVGVKVIGIDLHIIGASQWKYQDYTDTEDQVAIIHNTVVKRPFDNIVVETNNAGWHVIENLKREHHLPISAINTTGKIKDPKKLRDGSSMYKNDAVEWVKRVIQDTLSHKANVTHLYFPVKHSKGTLALWNQMPKMTKKITQAGNTTYGAQGKEHDDLIMALVLACYFARRKYIRKYVSDSVEVITSSYGRKNERKRHTAKDWFPELQGFNRVTNYSVNNIR